MFENSHAASGPPPDNYIQPDLGHGFRIWWAFYWRTFLSAVVLVVVVNTMLRIIWLNPGMPFGPSRLIVFVMRYDIYIFYYALSFLVLAYVIRKKFRKFRIALLSNFGGEGAEILPPTMRRTARVWWTFCWRSVVYRVIAGVAVMFPLGWIIGFLVALLPGARFAAFVNLVVQVVIDAAVGMFVIYSNILDEDISDFRVALMPRAAANAVPAPQAPEGITTA